MGAQNTLFFPSGGLLKVRGAGWPAGVYNSRRGNRSAIRDTLMMRAEEVVLYTRPDCHLCDVAAQMLEQCGVNWYRVDIETSLDLIRKYGAHVPVLYRPDVDRELFWPFTAETVEAFVELEI